MKKVIFLTLLLTVMFAGSSYGDLVIYAPMDGSATDIAGPTAPFVEGPGVSYRDSTTDPAGVKVGTGSLRVDRDAPGDDDKGVGYSQVVDTGEFTIAMWVGLETIVSETHYDIVNSITGPHQMQIWSPAWNTGAITCELNIGGWQPGAQTVDGVLGDGAFKHIAVTYNAEDLIIYVDGVEAASSLGINLPITMDGIELGHNGWIPPMDATYDDFRVYDHGLTATEVVALVPEPATITLLALSGLALIRRKR